MSSPAFYGNADRQGFINPDGGTVPVLHVGAFESCLSRVPPPPPPPGQQTEKQQTWQL
jgi:hypothetical protein